MKNLFNQICGPIGITLLVGATLLSAVDSSYATDQQLKFPVRSNGPEAQRLFEAAIGRESLGNSYTAADVSGNQAGAREQIVAPRPIIGNSGKYLSPYTSDKVLAEWTDKMISVKLGASVGSVAGSTAGTLVGQQAMKNVPFVGGMLGGMLGNKVGESAGKAMTLQAGGGWETIKKTSDISFNNLDDLAVYLYVNNSGHEHYQLALEALTTIYPEFQDHYQQAIRNAPRKAIDDEQVSSGQSKKQTSPASGPSGKKKKKPVVVHADEVN